MIRTPWKVVNLKDQDFQLGYGIREDNGEGELVAVGMTLQDAEAAAIAVNQIFPPGSQASKSPGIADPDYSKPFEPDPDIPKIA